MVHGNFLKLYTPGAVSAAENLKLMKETTTMLFMKNSNIIHRIAQKHAPAVPTPQCRIWRPLSLFGGTAALSKTNRSQSENGGGGFGREGKRAARHACSMYWPTPRPIWEP
jgi:hypothetical protein